MNPETKLQNAILLALSEAGCTVWRNETAGAWVGKVVHREASTVTLVNARMIQFGLATGSADIIGISPSGLFMAIEVKKGKGRTRKEQFTFIDAVNAAGGIAGIARSTGDALELAQQG